MSDYSNSQSDFEVAKNLRSDNASVPQISSTSVFIPDEVIDASLSEWRFSLIGRLDLVKIKLTTTESCLRKQWTLKGTWQFIPIDLLEVVSSYSFKEPTSRGRRIRGVLQWHPAAATQLMLASDDDSSPSLKVWLKCLKEFVGHTRGVIAMNWCPTDSRYLLTFGKDSRTLCWDTVSGEIVSELPAGMNFDLHWYPKIPGLVSASSFEGNVGFYNIEGHRRLNAGEAVVNS
ncbi:hypothetical protein MKW98_014588, partial [Papaver atlanticum]